MVDAGVRQEGAVRGRRFDAEDLGAVFGPAHELKEVALTGTDLAHASSLEPHFPIQRLDDVRESCRHRGNSRGIARSEDLVRPGVGDLPGGPALLDVDEAARSADVDRLALGVGAAVRDLECVRLATEVTGKLCYCGHTGG